MLKEFKTFCLTCNKCGRALKMRGNIIYDIEQGNNIQDVMNQAKEQGWTIGENYETLCPACGELNAWLYSKIQSEPDSHYTKYDGSRYSFIKGYHDAMNRFKDFLNSDD